MGRRSKIDKRLLWNVVERAYAEGIGCRRLGVMIGYSHMWVRSIARELGIGRLPPRLPHDAYAPPSPTLQRMIAEVKALVDAHDMALQCNLPVAGHSRPIDS